MINYILQTLDSFIPSEVARPIILGLLVYIAFKVWRTYDMLKDAVERAEKDRKQVTQEARQQIRRFTSTVDRTENKT